MRTVILAGLSLVACGLAWALGPDATRDEIIAELGKPTSVATREGREILIYPKGVRLELVNGRIASVKGIVLGDEQGRPSAPEPAVSVAAKPKKPETPPAGDPADDPERAAAAEHGAAQVQMEKAVLAMEGAHDKPVTLLAKPVFNPARLAVEFVLNGVFLLIVLKLSSRYWDSEISWQGLAIAAAADVTIRLVTREIGTRILGLPTLFNADQAVATLGLVMVVRRVSYNHALGKAVEIALTTKTFSVVVGAFIFTLALNYLF